MLNIIRMAMFALAMAFSAGASAQGGKVTRVLVGFPPGQATDLVARLVAELLSEALGHPVIVENRPGQGGSVVLDQLAKAPADGSVLSMSALAAYVVNPYLYKNVTYSTLKDFEPVALVADLPLVLGVHPSLPVHSLKDLVDYAKAHPDQLSHCSSGNGTLSHLLMDAFKRRAGIKILHVPYQGSPRAMNDLAGGAVQVGLDTATVMRPFVQAGKIRVIASGTQKRLAMFPDVPTFEEQGYPGFEAVAWIGLTAPAGTPLALRARINAEVNKALAEKTFADRLAGMGALPRPATVDEFGAFLRSEDQRWKGIVASSGTRVD